MARVLIHVGWTLGWLAAALYGLWAFGALSYDFPAWPAGVAIGFAVLQVAILVFVSGAPRKIAAVLVPSTLVLVWWLSLRPSDHAAWQKDVAQAAWAEVNGDLITLHNVRNCEYRTETDYTPRWETRVVHLSQITGIDLAINYWGSPWIAHPIASFQFADAPPVCFSIETRKQVGQTYSAVGGLYRQFPLIYIVADERDVIRVRTNFRHDEDVYLYRLVGPSEKARERFLDYIHGLNDLHARPRWYNALTTNCTTSIRTQHAAQDRAPFDWRIIANGKMDELLYERGVLDHSLPFVELKRHSLINAAAREAGDAADFSQLIRAGIPGF